MTLFYITNCNKMATADLYHLFCLTLSFKWPIDWTYESQKYPPPPLPAFSYRANLKSDMWRHCFVSLVNHNHYSSFIVHQFPKSQYFLEFIKETHFNSEFWSHLKNCPVSCVHYNRSALMILVAPCNKCTAQSVFGTQE